MSVCVCRGMAPSLLLGSRGSLPGRWVWGLRSWVPTAPSRTVATSHAWLLDFWNVAGLNEKCCSCDKHVRFYIVFLTRISHCWPAEIAFGLYWVKTCCWKYFDQFHLAFFPQPLDWCVSGSHCIWLVVLQGAAPQFWVLLTLCCCSSVSFSRVSKLSSVQQLSESSLPAEHRGFRGVGSTVPAGLPGLL